jgi:hypothetical protein
MLQILCPTLNFIRTVKASYDGDFEFATKSYFKEKNNL